MWAGDFDCPKLVISRLIGDCDRVELFFVEREASPKGMMEMAINNHFGGLSLFDTNFIFYISGVNLSKSTAQTGCNRRISYHAAVER